jgi:hypothetical protein
MAYVGYDSALSYSGGREGEQGTCGDTSGLQRITGTCEMIAKDWLSCYRQNKGDFGDMRPSVFLASSTTNSAIVRRRPCNSIATHCCFREDGLTKLRLEFGSTAGESFYSLDTAPAKSPSAYEGKARINHRAKARIGSESNLTLLFFRLRLPDQTLLMAMNLADLPHAMIQDTQ